MLIAYLQELLDSMPARYQAMIDANGLYTNYCNCSTRQNQEGLKRYIVKWGQVPLPY
jgi:hypothetical protein